jgi:hypothetical protein
VGKFSYGSKITAEIDDRVLANLHVVMAAKLRRGESFMFTWTEEDIHGGGRTIVWVNPTATLGFKFYGKRTPKINRRWVENLMLAANSVQGLQVVPEPSDYPEGPPSD